MTAGHSRAEPADVKKTPGFPGVAVVGAAIEPGLETRVS